MLQNLKLKLAEQAKKAKNIIELVKVDEDVRNERFEICKSCESLKFDFCKKCGCYMPAKTWLSDIKCPIEKW